MDIKLEKARAQANFTRFKSGQTAGHYESYFLRANHPSKPHAFWIRYTIFHPADAKRPALGELWGIYFDGDSGKHIAAKTEFSLSMAEYSNTNFHLNFNGAILNSNSLKGEAKSASHSINWDLKYTGGEGNTSAPLFLFPLNLYEGSFPKAKSLVSMPFASFSGTITVNGTKISINDWVGSQNHNWGSEHTDYYAWGQVCGFDNAPDVFLEIASAKIKLVGPIMSPFMTPIVLRMRGHDIAINSYSQILMAKVTLAKVSLNYFNWEFSSENDLVHIAGHIAAPKEDFAGLTYYNPPGGNKNCLNSKIASCEITVTEKSKTGLTQTFKTAHRAAFEVLTDKNDHGITISA